MTELFQLLEQMGVPPAKAVFDLTLARGLDYYTGPVFEAKVTEPKVGSVAGGGRYEGLIGAFGSRYVSATGVSFGLERIIEVVREHGRCRFHGGRTGFRSGYRPTLSAARLATELRQIGIKTDLSLLEGKSLGEQLKYAGRRGIRLAAALGPNETDCVCRGGEESRHRRADRYRAGAAFRNRLVVVDRLTVFIEERM
ncbi:MAG: ATP phosphoribosyltransferase regulatory subunit [Thermomicrobiales bacterium]